MKDTDINTRFDMYPLEPEVLWGLMNRHKLVLINSASVLDTNEVYTPTSQYSYYRYFLKLKIESRYWVAVLVTNDIGSINEKVDPSKGLLIPDYRLVEQIYISI